MTEVGGYEPLGGEEKRGIGCVATLLLCFFAGAFFVFYIVDYRMAGPDYYTFPSPDGNRAAFLISTLNLGMATPLELFVSPTGSMKDMRWVGTVCFDDDLALAELAWTSDSDFVTAKCSKRIDDYQNNSAITYNVYYCGYRFSSMTVFAVGDNYNEPKVLKARSDEIEHILSDKGGPMVVAKGRREPVDATVKAKPLGWLQLRKCRSLIEKAKEVEQEKLRH
jgi:hypothetical protein